MASRRCGAREPGAGAANYCELNKGHPGQHQSDDGHAWPRRRRKKRANPFPVVPVVVIGLALTGAGVAFAVHKSRQAAELASARSAGAAAGESVADDILSGASFQTADDGGDVAGPDAEAFSEGSGASPGNNGFEVASGFDGSGRDDFGGEDDFANGGEFAGEETVFDA